MFSKLAAVILTIGAVAATLLAARQQRIQAVHEAADAMRRITEHDRTLWRLRGEVADRVTPSKVRKMTERLGPFAFFYSQRTSSLIAHGLMPAPGSAQPAALHSIKPRIEEPETTETPPIDSHSSQDTVEVPTDDPGVDGNGADAGGGER